MVRLWLVAGTAYGGLQVIDASMGGLIGFEVTGSFCLHIFREFTLTYRVVRDHTTCLKRLLTTFVKRSS